MHFEILSDRDVYLDGIGLLKANVPVEISETELHLFKVLHSVDIISANFSPFIKLTVVVDLETSIEGRE